MAVKPVPEGHNNVSPYLLVPHAAQVIAFLKDVLGGKELHRHADSKGVIRHAEVKIGDSVIMISDATPEFPAMPAMVHVYLPDVDAAYRRAIAGGAKSLREPADQFYGDRGAGVVDPGGNHWWLSTHVEDVSEAEMARRAEAAEKQHAS